MSVYTPGNLVCVGEAFERAASSLRFALASRDAADAEIILEVLAKKVMEVAETGERDPKALVDMTLEQLPPLQSGY